MRLVEDKKVAEPRDAVMALAEYQQRAPDNRDRDLAVRLLTRRGGSCTWLALVNKLRLNGG